MGKPPKPIVVAKVEEPDFGRRDMTLRWTTGADDRMLPGVGGSRKPLINPPEKPSVEVVAGE